MINIVMNQSVIEIHFFIIPMTAVVNQVNLIRVQSCLEHEDSLSHGVTNLGIR